MFDFSEDLDNGVPYLLATYNPQGLSPAFINNQKGGVKLQVVSSDECGVMFLLKDAQVWLELIRNAFVDETLGGQARGAVLFGEENRVMKGVHQKSL